MPVWITSHLRHPLISLLRTKHITQRILTLAGQPDAAISLVFVGDHRMRRLNREHRGQDNSTDVLTFAMPSCSGASPMLLGDVIISADTAERQATKSGQSLDHEITSLITHGILHLLGYDHEQSEQEARRMRRRELFILKLLTPLPKFSTSPRKQTHPIRN